ncbi:MAG: hypothetical protein M9927_14650 [Anaerolineae bacterium]|nr:hypothetical protein [Anaerolineae bacterium]
MTGILPYFPAFCVSRFRHPLYPHLDAHRLHRNSGHYEISYASAPGGPFTVYGQTADKTVSRGSVAGPNDPYYFRLRTHDPHAANAAYECSYQPNTVISEYTEVVASGGWDPPPTETPTGTSTPTATATAPRRPRPGCGCH